MPRGARVLRLAPVPLRPGRLPDLERIFATAVVVTDATTTDPTTLLEAAESLAVDAVVLDVVAPRRCPSSSTPSLSTDYSGRRGLRPERAAANASPGFAGYGLVEPDGTLRAVGDGELAPPD